MGDIRKDQQLCRDGVFNRNSIVVFEGGFCDVLCGSCFIKSRPLTELLSSTMVHLSERKKMRVERPTEGGNGRPDRVTVVRKDTRRNTLIFKQQAPHKSHPRRPLAFPYTYPPPSCDFLIECQNFSNPLSPFLLRTYDDVSLKIVNNFLGRFGATIASLLLYFLCFYASRSQKKKLLKFESLGACFPSDPVLFLGSTLHCCV